MSLSPTQLNLDAQKPCEVAQSLSAGGDRSLVRLFLPERRGVHQKTIDVFCFDFSEIASTQTLHDLLASRTFDVEWFTWIGNGPFKKGALTVSMRQDHFRCFFNCFDLLMRADVGRDLKPLDLTATYIDV